LPRIKSLLTVTARSQIADCATQKSVTSSGSLAGGMH